VRAAVFNAPMIEDGWRGLCAVAKSAKEIFFQLKKAAALFLLNEHDPDLGIVSPDGLACSDGLACD
jgi:hypothetical protein